MKNASFSTRYVIFSMTTPTCLNIAWIRSLGIVSNDETQSIIAFCHIGACGVTFHLKRRLLGYFNVGFIGVPCLETHDFYKQCKA